MKCLDCFGRYDIILGSQSPRRKLLMEGARIPFRVMARPVPEVFPGYLPPLEVVKYLCRQKAACFEQELKDPGKLVITADTIVVHKGDIINKPGDESEAFKMLTALSGSTHEVYTGVCMRKLDDERIFHDYSLVSFRELRSDEIRYYIDSCSPFDKAGAYGIQEWIGYIGISGIQGSYHNVMGLPVHKVYSELLDMLCKRP